MGRRRGLALIAAAILVLVTVALLGGRSSGGSTTDASRSGTSSHVDQTVLPSVGIPSIRPADHRFDPTRLPWLPAIGPVALALLVAAGLAGVLRPATVAVRRGPAPSAHRGRAPPGRA